MLRAPDPGPFGIPQGPDPAAELAIEAERPSVESTRSLSESVDEAFRIRLNRKGTTLELRGRIRGRRMRSAR